MRGALERQIGNAGLNGQVELLGAVTLEGVEAEHSRATIYVQPSIRTDYGRQDGIPNTIAEALASALPVVATNVSGIPELVQDEETGLLVPQKDAVALADAMQRLLEDANLRAQLGAAGRRKVEEDFDFATVSREFPALLRATLG